MSVSNNSSLATVGSDSCESEVGSDNTTSGSDRLDASEIGSFAGILGCSENNGSSGGVVIDNGHESIISQTLTL